MYRNIDFKEKRQRNDKFKKHSLSLSLCMHTTSKQIYISCTRKKKSVEFVNKLYKRAKKKLSENN